MKVQDTYIKTRTIEFPGMVVRIYQPNLTPEERSARMKSIHNQAANLLKKVK